MEMNKKPNRKQKIAKNLVVINIIRWSGFQNNLKAYPFVMSLCAYPMLNID
jgi:hypothetical protein